MKIVKCSLFFSEIIIITSPNPPARQGKTAAKTLGKSLNIEASPDTVG